MWWRATPPCNRAQLRGRSGQRWVFRSTPLSGLHARGAIALPPRQQKRAWAQGRRTRARPGIRIRMRMWVHVQCSPIQHSSMPAGQRELAWQAISGCAPRAAAGRSQPGLGLGLISAAMEVNSHMHPRAHANANADITAADMRMSGRECKALELIPPRALLLARRKCDGLARAQPKGGVPRMRKPSGGLSCQRSCGCRGACAHATVPPKQTDHSFNHDCTVLASMYSCYHECIHVSYRRRA
jgi:hypothetical protein